MPLMFCTADCQSLSLPPPMFAAAATILVVVVLLKLFLGMTKALVNSTRMASNVAGIKCMVPPGFFLIFSSFGQSDDTGRS